jgi:hypothetical protein
MDIQPARWVEKRITSFAASVASLVPEGFAAYARILHPSGDTRWSDIAGVTGRVVHAEVQWQHLVTPPGQVIPPHQWDATSRWGLPPSGSLPRQQLVQLAGLLSSFTSTPDRIWFCLWDGYGDLHPPGEWRRSVDRLAREAHEVWHPDPHPHAELFEGRPDRPRLRLPNRAYLVYGGALNEVAAWRWQGPNLWWPDDCAWFVTSEIDLVSTYVGGSAALVHALGAGAGLEVLPVPIAAAITASADRVNH